MSFRSLPLMLLALLHSVSATAQDGGPEPAITRQQVIALAVNRLEPVRDGYRLRHPRHEARFTADGVRFTPRRGGPQWHWSLEQVSAGGEVPRQVSSGPVQPLNDAAGQVTYRRGALLERYVARQDAVEQQFVLPQALGLRGADLVLLGKVRSEASFETSGQGWVWRAEGGVVSLGTVRVYDAAGKDLPARMTATAHSTRIEVDGAALEKASYPVTIDPEIGTNDFRISDMGNDPLSLGAFHPAIAFNSVDDKYLVVWQGDTDRDGGADDEFEIYGKLLGANGLSSGPEFRISDMGPRGDLAFLAADPAVAHDPVHNQYLVVWTGDDDTAPLVDGEFEIFGQRLQSDGTPTGTDDFRISSMGTDGSTAFGTSSPAVAYNPTDDEFLVVWTGDDNTSPLVNGELEVFGQRLDAATGAQVGTDDFRISDMGTNGSTLFRAVEPAVAYNPTNNQYLVVWRGDDNTAPLVDNEFEIFGQRLDAATGAAVGTNDFRISDMGPDGNASFGAFRPAVGYNLTNNEYLVVWDGDDDTGLLVDNENEIYAQRLDAATGAQVGTNDLRISDMGQDGDAAFDAFSPAVVHDFVLNQYLVLWVGDDDTGALVDNEFEVHGQRLDAATLAALGANDFRISNMGPDGDPAYSASAARPAVAFDDEALRFLGIWAGTTKGMEIGQTEIFSQRLEEDGTPFGFDDRISHMSVSRADFDAHAPAVAYNSTNNEYLVVWYGDDDTGDLVNDEFEIYGQRIDAATGAEVGTNDFRISNMGTDGDSDSHAFEPAVAYNSTNNEYLVVWRGSVSGAVWSQIFGQRLNAATGAAVGTNDFRISDMGPTYLTSGFGAFEPAIAYNSVNNEYLVVWSGADNAPPLVANEDEIFGQRLNAATGAAVGANDFRISDMGPDGNTNFGASEPAVAYNSVNNEYLVVWRGDDNTAPLVNDEVEVFGQRLDAATGAAVGTNDFRISDMGPDGDTDFGAFNPAVAHDSTDNEYLVVWSGDDNTPPLADNELEIFGQRLDAATGAAVGANDFRISDMGLDGFTSFRAVAPAVAYNGTANEYLVLWTGNDNIPPVAQEDEVFGQRLDAATGTALGANDFRISDMGPDGSFGYQVFGVSLAYSSAANESLAVWRSEEDTPPLVKDELEIFGQRYSAVETPIPTQTATPTSTSTNTATATRTPSRTPTRTSTRTATRTSTPTRTATVTSTVTATPTSTAAATDTATASPTATETATASPTSTAAATDTATASPTATETATASPTATATATNTATASPAATETATATPTATATNSATATDTPTATATLTATPTGTATATLTGTLTTTATAIETPTHPATGTDTPSPTATGTPAAPAAVAFLSDSLAAGGPVQATASLPAGDYLICVVPNGSYAAATPYPGQRLSCVEVSAGIEPLQAFTVWPSARPGTFDLLALQAADRQTIVAGDDLGPEGGLEVAATVAAPSVWVLALLCLVLSRPRRRLHR